MKREYLNEQSRAELMMLCGALHDLSEIVRDKKVSAHLIIIEQKLEKIIILKTPKQKISKVLDL